MSTALVADSAPFISPRMQELKGPNNTVTYWRDDATARLEQLFIGQRLSAQVTADKLNDEFDMHLSRSAVLGKADRCGFKKGRVRAAIDKDAAAKFGFRLYPPKREPARTPAQLEAARIAKQKASMAEEKAAVALIVAERMAREPVTLMDLTAGACRWPFGDPREKAFRFCGAAAVELGGAFRPYCAGHGALAYVAR